MNLIKWFIEKIKKGSFMNFSSELILVFSSHKAVILLQMTWNKHMSHINYFLDDFVSFESFTSCSL